MAKSKAPRSALQTALKANPNWKAATPLVSDRQSKSVADVVTPELASLRRKVLGDVSVAMDSAPRGKKASAKEGNMTMVRLEPKTQTDTPLGSKTVLVHKGKVVGESG